MKELSFKSNYYYWIAQNTQKNKTILHDYSIKAKDTIRMAL